MARAGMLARRSLILSQRGRHARRICSTPRRHRRRRAHSVRALDGRVRRSEQPGDAHRDAQGAGRALQPAGRNCSATSAPARCSSIRRTSISRANACSTAASSPETPAFDLQRACGTSLDTAIVIGLKIATGQIDSGIAAGVDTASDVPIVYPKAYRQLLLRSARGRSFGEQAVARGSACGRATSSRSCPAWSSRAPACRWARAAS